MTTNRNLKIIRLVPGLGLPEYMAFLFKQCEPIGYTRKAIEAGHLLKISYHPPYLELKCSNIHRITEEAKKKHLRIYKGRKHITITDGVYQARIYMPNTE